MIEIMPSAIFRPIAISELCNNSYVTIIKMKGKNVPIRVKVRMRLFMPDFFIQVSSGVVVETPD